MVVEASEAVPWTKPDSDLPFDPEAKPSLHGAGSPHPGGFNAMFVDGSVRFISRQGRPDRVQGPDHAGPGARCSTGRSSGERPRGTAVAACRGGDHRRPTDRQDEPPDEETDMGPGVTPIGKDGSSMGRGARHLVLGALLILAASPGWARAQAPADAAAKAGAAPLARYAPARGWSATWSSTGSTPTTPRGRPRPPTRCSTRPSWVRCSRTSSPSWSSRPRHRCRRAT